MGSEPWGGCFIDDGTSVVDECTQSYRSWGWTTTPIRTGIDFCTIDGTSDFDEST
jgi:hypothetical protein